MTSVTLTGCALCFIIEPRAFITSSRAPASPASTTRAMRIFTWNVNSLVPTVRNINLRYGSLAAFFQHLDADIVCMQEVKLPDAKITRDLALVDGYQAYFCCSQGKTGYSGVTTWARLGCAALSAEADPFACEGCDKEGRALVTDHGSFVLLNLYVPNAGDRPERARLGPKLAFLAAVKERVDDLLGAGRQVIVVGDLNIASQPRDVHDAITWATLYDPAELAALHGIIDAHGSNCVDTWRHLHPDTDGVYTVWEERKSSRAFNVGLRIDYILLSSGLLPHAMSCEVLLDLPPKWSDHAPCVLDLAVPAGQNAPAAAAAGDGAQPQTAAAAAVARPPECALWQALRKRFQDPSQPSIASVFKAVASKGGSSSGGSNKQQATPGGSSEAAARVTDAEGALATAPARPQQDDTAAAAAGDQQPQQQQQQPKKRPHEEEGPAAPGSTKRRASDVQQADGTAAAAAAAEQQLEAQQQQPSSAAAQQQQSSQRAPSQGGGSSGGSKPGGRQPAAAGKKAGGSGGRGKAAGAAVDPKQAKLSSFFAKASAGPGKK